MSKQPSPEETYAWAAARCARQEQCRADLAHKLYERGLGRADAEALLDRLEGEGYIDDARYARAFVHDKTAYDRWGKLKVWQALRLKRISDAAISEAWEQVDEEAYRQGLESLLRQKGRTVKAADPYLLRQKLARFAIGRGFEPSLVARFLDLGEE